MEQKNNTDKTQIKKTNNTQAHQPHTSGLLQPLPDTIYHNVSLRAPLKRAERDSAANTAKRDVFPGVNRKNASGSLSAHCIAMHESEWRSVWRVRCLKGLFSDVFVLRRRFSGSSRWPYAAPQRCLPHSAGSSTAAP